MKGTMREKSKVKEYEYKGNKIVNDIVKKLIYPDGIVKEFHKVSGGGYWVVYKERENKVETPMFCPKCKMLMDWIDEKVFLEEGRCERCSQFNK